MSPETLTPSLPIGWAIVLAAAALLLGGGGVAALIKAISDRRQGVQSMEVTEDDAIAERWRALSDAQVKNLLQPMETRLAKVEGELAALRVELASSRAKYWRAISYIRTLLTWVTSHMPEEATPPPAPANLAEDINI